MGARLRRPGVGLWKSTDGGDTWKKLTEGLPEEMWGRIGVAASAAKPGRVWAIVEAKKGGLYVSDDDGEKWTHVNDEHKIRERAWYYTCVYADPKNAETVWLPNVAAPPLERRRQVVFGHLRPARRYTTTSGSIPTTRSA